MEPVLDAVMRVDVQPESPEARLANDVRTQEGSGVVLQAASWTMKKSGQSEPQRPHTCGEYTYGSVRATRNEHPTQLVVTRSRLERRPRRRDIRCQLESSVAAIRDDSRCTRNLRTLSTAKGTDLELASDLVEFALGSATLADGDVMGISGMNS